MKQKRQYIRQSKIALNKEQFMQQYVLNRCIGNTGDMEGASVAKESLKAWNKIKDNLKEGK